MLAAAGLTIVQAALGGFLVDTGTNTHWLFLHQGNSALILGCVLWSLLRLLEGRRTAPALAPTARPMMRRVLGFAAVAAWVQLVLGGLVAGSKFNAAFVTEFPTMMGGRYLPPLWETALPVSWNLLDNAWLHQWAHRWFAWVLVVALATVYALAARSEIGPRLRLALQVSATFVAVQVILGIASVLVAGAANAPALPLAHQLMGMCLFCGVILAWYDARNEPVAAVEQIPEPKPVLVERIA
jgi:cytochrome c oxidase assembly protein subunit 15